MGVTGSCNRPIHGNIESIGKYFCGYTGQIPFVYFLPSPANMDSNTFLYKFSSCLSLRWSHSGEPPLTVDSTKILVTPQRYFYPPVLLISAPYICPVSFKTTVHRNIHNLYILIHKLCFCTTIKFILQQCYFYVRRSVGWLLFI